MNSIKRFIKNLEIKNYILYIFILLILSCFTITYILLIPDSELVKDKSISVYGPKGGHIEGITDELKEDDSIKIFNYEY